MNGTIGELVRVRRMRLALLSAAVAGTTALAGCSGGASGGGSSGSGQFGVHTSGATVAVMSSVKGDVLTDARGRVLYVSDQETGRSLCKSTACTTIWAPLIVGSGQTPTGPARLTGTLSTIKRSDGKAQVALSGKPLYTFRFDHKAGEVNGDGLRDSFDGTHFTWHVVATGAGPAPSSSSSSSSNRRYGY